MIEGDSKNKTILKVKNISRAFPGVQALNKINFELTRGEIHALVGENGAGKSTLIKILTGYHTLDSGKIEINGSEVEIKNPSEAIKVGITAVYQELSLFQNLSIAENIFVKNKPNKANFINTKELYKRTESLLKSFDINVKASTLVSNMSAAAKQEIEIIKAVSLHTKILILDEPTSSLSKFEVDKLFKILNQLKKQGVSIIYITHHLEEIFKIANRVTVFKDGKNVDTLKILDTSENLIAKMMVGRDIKEMFKVGNNDVKKEIVMKVKDYSDFKFFKNVSFELHKGEILGFFGLVGAGRSELAQTIFGLNQVKKGRLEIFGKQVKITSAEQAISLGIGFVSENRKELGLFPEMTLRENLIAPSLRKFSNKLNWLNDRKIKRISNDYIKMLKISTPSIESKVFNLSGGNQQKVLLAVWLITKSKILIVDEPTRGVDIGTKAEIHYLLKELSNSGVTIILISSELPEILGLSDRVVVMREGSIMNIINNNGTNLKKMEEKIMMNASGVKDVK